MRILVLLLWIFFLLYGARRIRERVPAAPAARVIPSGCLPASQKNRLPHFAAMRPMQVNWRVRDSDLAARGEGSPAPPRTDYVGRYLACKIAAGEPVTASDLGSQPIVPPASGKVLYLLPLQPNAVDAVNAGNHIDIFQGEHGIIRDADVETVVPSPGPTGWDAVIQISAAEDQLLKEQNAQSLKWILRR